MRAAAFTQAEIERALRAAKEAGPRWVVEVERGVLRFRQADDRAEQPRSATAPETLTEERKAEPEWRMW